MVLMVLQVVVAPLLLRGQVEGFVDGAKALFQAGRGEDVDLQLLAQRQYRDDPPRPRRPVHQLLPVLLQSGHPPEALRNLRLFPLLQVRMPSDGFFVNLLMQPPDNITSGEGIFRLVFDELHVGRIVTVLFVSGYYAESASPDGGEDRATVPELDAVPDVQHGTVLDVPLAVVLGESDAELTFPGFDRSPDHQLVAGFVDKQRAGDGGEGRGADEHGDGRFAAVQFLALALFVRVRDKPLHGLLDEGRNLTFGQ